MGRWQPPIPSGALWSPEVIASNAGALLAYCYDAVRTDGTFTIQLAEAAGEMNVEYRTIKRWWAALRTGPFFADVQDRGRLGFVVRMADDWLDWRILRARQVVQPEGPNMAHEDIKVEGTDTTPDVAQVPVKAISRSNDGPEMAPDTIGNKVLMTSVQHELTIAADAATSPPAEAPGKKSRGRKQPQQANPNQQHPAVLVFYELTGRRPSDEGADLIAGVVDDLDRWRGTVRHWLGSGWFKGNAKGMVNRYQRLDDREQETDRYDRQTPGRPAAPRRPVSAAIPAAVDPDGPSIEDRILAYTADAVAAYRAGGSHE